MGMVFSRLGLRSWVAEPGLGIAGSEEAGTQQEAEPGVLLAYRTTGVGTRVERDDDDQAADY